MVRGEKQGTDVTEQLKFRAGRRYRDKNTDKGTLFQAGNNSTQQLCQEGKLKMNMYVCVFYSWEAG